MGRKHREIRKATKIRFLQIGIKENEFGEFVKKTSKAEARRIIVKRREVFLARSLEVIDRASRLALLELTRVTDDEMLKEWEKMMIITDVMLS